MSQEDGIRPIGKDHLAAYREARRIERVRERERMAAWKARNREIRELDPQLRHLRNQYAFAEARLREAVARVDQIKDRLSAVQARWEQLVFGDEL